MKINVTNHKSKHFHYFYAFNKKDEKIGWASIEITDSLHYTFKQYCNEMPDKCAKIVYIKTYKTYRNQGVATTILNEIIKKYEDWDLFLQVIPLDTNNTVQTLTKFYEKFGFERCETPGSTPTMIKPAKI